MEFRDRVGVLVNGIRRDGQVVEVMRPAPLGSLGLLGDVYAAAAISGSAMVRVWIDGEGQPMQELVPERDLYR